MPQSAQDFLEIGTIREGVLVLKNKTIRGVMLVSAQNFALKSEEEQDATIFQFQNFLNSLDFSLQILIQSRRLNITGYLDYLRDLDGKQQNDLMRSLTQDYRQFVEQLIQGASIMAKNFFVVVPFSLIETVPMEQRKGFQAPKISGEMSEEEFERMKFQLWQRMEFVALGLRRVGLKTAPLSNEELMEMMWGWHHPKEAEIGYYPDIPPEIFR
ncbi:MAG: hypothetical protein Q7S63_03350 [bacterium]|nr:hypothetical protein [bacterium]